MGTDENAKKILLHFDRGNQSSVVLDADALTILSQEKKGLKLLPEHSIVTPHPKEFERLFGKTSNWLERHQLQTIRSCKAPHLHCIERRLYLHQHTGRKMFF
jgi:NAD(P)H-hydrate epimerase